MKCIALLGQPNSGKSTAFNQLTGSRQHVGNWPGKTVEKKDGTYSYNNEKYTIVDLPGGYGLSGNSDEESLKEAWIKCFDMFKRALRTVTLVLSCIVYHIALPFLG